MVNQINKNGRFGLLSKLKVNHNPAPRNGQRLQKRPVPPPFPLSSASLYIQCFESDFLVINGTKRLQESCLPIYNFTIHAYCCQCKVIIQKQIKIFTQQIPVQTELVVTRYDM